ncbi:unknown [Clostridium sp. CAG:524]|jgi:hypothetical protein|nr:unknown [Clostridium sp. CAG:524]
MKKITIFILLFCVVKVNALSNIKVNNEELIPSFDKEIKVYNYYTDSESVNINVKKDKNEIVNGEGMYTLDNNYKKIIISSNIDNDYVINVFKNYDKREYDSSELLSLNIDGYNINYNKDIYDYDITLNNENNLNIKYEVNDNTSVVITGNGNFNKSNNLIKIKVGDKVYNIHAHKTIKVSYSKDREIIKEMSGTKKEIVKVLIITISCSFVFLFYKFISKI